MRELSHWQHRIFVVAALFVLWYGISEHSRQQAHERTRHEHILEIRSDLHEIKTMLDHAAQEDTARRLEYKMEHLNEQVKDLRQAAKELCEIEYDRGFDEAMDVAEDEYLVSNEPPC